MRLRGEIDDYLLLPDEVRQHKFWLKILGCNYGLHTKPETEGCAEAARWRWDPRKERLGVPLATEMKTLMVYAGETNIQGQDAILAFHLPADCKLASDGTFKNVDFFGGTITDEDRIIFPPETCVPEVLSMDKTPTKFSKFDRDRALKILKMAPFTINPISIFCAQQSRACDTTIPPIFHIFDSSLYTRETTVSTNAGHREWSMVIENCAGFIQAFSRMLERTVAVAADETAPIQTFFRAFLKT